MNIKKIIILLLFLIAIIGIIAPATAKLDSNLELESMKTVKGKTKLYITVNSNIGYKKNKEIFYTSNKYNSNRKKELNSINKIGINIKGYKTVTLKKPKKGWKSSKYNLFFDKTFTIKGNHQKIDNAQYSIKLYNNKNKVIKNKKSTVSSEWYQTETEISKNPKKYFDKLESKNKKNAVLYYPNPTRITSSRNIATGKMIATSSGKSYYFNVNSIFKKEDINETFYYTSMSYMVKKPEATRNYTNGEYTIYISSYKGNTTGKWFKNIGLVRNSSRLTYSSIKNPYFTISKECNWKDPSILNLAATIKKSVNRSDYANEDLYTTELANAVLRYLQRNITYDYTYSKDQTATTTLQRKSGTCYGGTMLAGALLRALGIPTYFHSEWANNRVDPVTGSNIVGHTWPLAYILYNGVYNWVPSETTTYIGNRSDLFEQPKYKSPFYFGANSWWSDKGGIYKTLTGYGNYYQ